MRGHAEKGPYNRIMPRGAAPAPHASELGRSRQLLDAPHTLHIALSLHVS